MDTKKKSPKPEYYTLFYKLTDYEVAVDASINYEVRDKRNQYSDANVYSFSSRMELEGVCIHHEDREGHIGLFTIYGTDSERHGLDIQLKDCHEMDDDGDRKYRRVRGQSVPVYNVPKGIGHIEKVRGEDAWAGWAWVKPQTFNDMLILLSSVKPIYISIHELKIGRVRHMVSFTLGNKDPEEE